MACVAEASEARSTEGSVRSAGDLGHICAAAEFCGRCTIPAVELPAAGPPPPGASRRREAQERAALRAYRPFGPTLVVFYNLGASTAPFPRIGGRGECPIEAVADRCTIPGFSGRS